MIINTPPPVATDASTLEDAVAIDAAGLDAYATTRTGPDLQQLVKQHGVVVSARQAGGPENATEGEYTVYLEVYAARYGQMWAKAREISARLRHPGRDVGIYPVDRAQCVSSFAERPIAEGTRVLVSTWVFTVRHHPRRG